MRHRATQLLLESYGREVMDRLTDREAYAAMFAFLVHWYEMTRSEDLAGLLGSMSLLADDRPLDPAVWEDWLAAIRDAKAGCVDLQLRLKP